MTDKLQLQTTNVYVSDVDAIFFNNGKFIIRDPGCGCCSHEQSISKADALKKIDEMIAELTAAYADIQAMQEGETNHE
jgi:hypothetical protein